ncbi:bidirectional sugar transporter SWEET2a-like [Impatiens glandulifera]|uniref:bidirectional sugar transporter SWEET2a-like n=1 Tax=Impatiens glandulifera TaxID=253017 RepID=UPI001FB124F0|nr:bidirectional sugar transporter SWEET2a-like [Impatiens glandulifera]
MYFKLFCRPTFKRIIRNKSTEQFSGLPLHLCSLELLDMFRYGMPLVSPDIILVATVNSIGASFQFVYIAIFILHADSLQRMKMAGLLLAVFAAFLAIVLVSLQLFQPPERQIFVGYLSVVSLISMFASPLSVINLVMKTKSVEYMPFYLSGSTFLMSMSFFAYGMCKYDPFIYIPNGIGAFLGIIQLSLYYYYRQLYGDASKEPLLEEYYV